MDASIPHTDSDDLAQTMKFAQLEYAYERALRQVDRLYEEENQRALRVQLLLLENENDELQEQIEGNEDDIHRLEESNEDLHHHNTAVQGDLQRIQIDLKAQLRENERIRTELDALNASNTDATRILSEKLALAREVNTLKPELEHLRSQAASQQNFLAEKLALERELSTIQVELDTEKRTVQRLKTSNKSAIVEDSNLQSELEEAKKELAEARKQIQKHEKDSRKRVTDWENEKDTLENKLEAFRTKLRSTKDQLKEAQDELEKSQAARMAQSAELTKARITGANPRKRQVARFDPDMTIGTPGHGRPVAKKQKMSIAAVGDKSTFSMTPFLNKTLSILPESPSENEPEAEKEIRASINGQIDAETDSNKAATIQPVLAPSSQVAQVPKTKSVFSKLAQDTAKPATPLTESSNVKVKAPAAKSSLFNTKSVSQEVENVENESVDKALEPEPIKKQKVLIKRANIFDEEDDAAATKAKPNLFAPSVASLKGIGAAGGPSLLGGSSLRVGKMNLTSLSRGKGRGTKLLAEFSPLKKDRRILTTTAET